MLEGPKRRYFPSKKKLDYFRYYLVFGEPTFDNAYRSALKAGFSESYAKKISAYMSYWDAVILVKALKDGGESIGEEFNESIALLERIKSNKRS